MFRTTTNDDISTLRHVASISLKADENGYIESITGKAHGKLISYAKKLLKEKKIANMEH